MTKFKRLMPVLAFSLFMVSSSTYAAIGPGPQPTPATDMLEEYDLGWLDNNVLRDKCEMMAGGTDAMNAKSLNPSECKSSRSYYKLASKTEQQIRKIMSEVNSQDEEDYIVDILESLSTLHTKTRTSRKKFVIEYMHVRLVSTLRDIYNEDIILDEPSLVCTKDMIYCSGNIVARDPNNNCGCPTTPDISEMNITINGMKRMGSYGSVNNNQAMVGDYISRQFPLTTDASTTYRLHTLKMESNLNSQRIAKFNIVCDGKIIRSADFSQSLVDGASIGLDDIAVVPASANSCFINVTTEATSVINQPSIFKISLKYKDKNNNLKNTSSPAYGIDIIGKPFNQPAGTLNIPNGYHSKTNTDGYTIGELVYRTFPIFTDTNVLYEIDKIDLLSTDGSQKIIKYNIQCDNKLFAGKDRSTTSTLNAFDYPNIALDPQQQSSCVLTVVTKANSESRVSTIQVGTSYSAINKIDNNSQENKSSVTSNFISITN